MDGSGPGTALVAEQRQRYVENLAALYVSDPQLAADVDALPFSQTPPLETARDGGLTVRLTADDGRPIYAHSRYRPTDEARQIVESQYKRKIGGRNAEEAEPESSDAAEEEELANPCFLIAGLGLGHHLAELERRFSRPLMIVAEDDLALLKAALCVADLAAPLREKRMTFLTAADKALVHRKLRAAITHLVLGMKFITLPHTARVHAAFHTQIRVLMRDFMAFCRIQMFSLLRHARITCQNVAFNLPKYIRRPGVEVLTGRAQGYPAIIVAAGPSLARNIDQLGPLRDRVVLIAVQTVLKTLQARGIEPHFVTSLDYHELSAQFFHGITDFGDTILVAEPKANWRVLDAYGGRTHVLHSAFADDLLRDAAPARGALRAGSTVAHLAFYLAEHLGCDPIIFVGQDLSFSEGLYYPPGMQIEQVWQPELGRFNTIEMKQWERIVRQRAGLRTVKDVHGRDTYTDEQLFTYAEQFASDFLASDSRIIQASEGGLPLAGTEVMPLREAAARYCARPLPRGLFAGGTDTASGDAKPAVCAALETRLKEVRQVRQIAVETAELLGRLVKLVERPAEFNRLIARVDELRSRMQRSDSTYNLVVQVAQLAELRRIQADRAIHDEDVETPATARRRLRRDREYVIEFIEGCDFLLRMLPEALRRVREQVA